MGWFFPEPIAEFQFLVKWGAPFQWPKINGGEIYNPNYRGCRFGPESSSRQTLVSPILKNRLGTICGGLFPNMYRGPICNLELSIKNRLTKNIHREQGYPGISKARMFSSKTELGVISI